MHKVNGEEYTIFKETLTFAFFQHALHHPGEASSFYSDQRVTLLRPTIELSPTKLRKTDERRNFGKKKFGYYNFVL